VENGFHHPIEIFPNLVVPEPQDSIAGLLKIGGPHGIAPQSGLISVLLAVEFHDEAQSVMSKIRKIGSDRSLAAEVPARELQPPKRRPKAPLYWGRVTSETASVRNARVGSITDIARRRSPHP
jgi:hypothetical protein